MDVDTDFCAMWGHIWCSVQISKEIQEFASGKAEGFERLGGKDGATPGAPARSGALTPEQQALLNQRGYLKPEEVHKLASKTKKAVAPAPAQGGEGWGEGVYRRSQSRVPLGLRRPGRGEADPGVEAGAAQHAAGARDCGGGWGGVKEDGYRKENPSAPVCASCRGL